MCIIAKWILIAILAAGIRVDTSDFYGVRMDHAEDIPLPNRAKSRGAAREIQTHSIWL